MPNSTEARRRRAERLRKDPSLAPHGDDSTYKNWMCRCPPCTRAHNYESNIIGARMRRAA